MMHEKIKKLKESGDLAFFMRHGAMPPHILFYYDVYQKVESLKMQNIGTRQAVIHTSITCNVCEATIYKAIKMMRAQ